MATQPPPCEAARANAMALYEIELSWGNGVVDLGKLRAILSKKTAQTCAHEDHETTGTLGNSR